MSEHIPTIGHFIAGEEVFEGEVKERRNPADTNEVVAQYHDGTHGVLDAAIDSAREAFSVWSSTTRRDRAEVIFRAAARLDTDDELRTGFRNAMIAEIGKTTAGANGEIAKTVRILRHMAGLATHTPDSVIHADQQQVHMYTQTEPVGVAGLITPFNFPLAVPAWKIAPALVAGCTVVVKPSPAAPITSSLLTKLFHDAINESPALHQAGIGPGVVNLVYGGPEIVNSLVQNPDIQAVSFTGSTEAGKSILRLAINREPSLDPRHFVAERGGQNALVVLKDADLDQAVSAAINGAFLGEGQRCTATSRFIVEEPVYDDFMELLLTRTSKLKIGPGKDSSNEIGPLVSDEALKTVINAVRNSIANGMDCVCGGYCLMDGNLSLGYFIQPTILKGNPRNSAHLALREEIFGPVAGVCSVQDLNDAISVVNETVSHRHAASVFTGNLSFAFEFANRVNCGMVHVNNPTLGGDAQAPFGGFGGDTSFGPREMGLRCMDPFTRDKTVDINWGGASLGRGVR